jgi:hypothetical protein
MFKAIAPDGSCHQGLGKENSLNTLNSLNSLITLITPITLNNYCPVNMRNKK